VAFTGRYLKPGKRAHTPGVVFSVTVKTKSDNNSGRSTYTDSYFSRAVGSVSKKSRGKWSKPRVAVFNRPEELYNWIRAQSEPRKRNYIVCPCASTVLTLTRWWEYAEQCGILFKPKELAVDTIDSDSNLASMLFVSRLCLRGKPDIFSYRHFGKSYMWLSGIQYFDASETVLSDSVGYLIPEQYRGYRNHSDQHKRLIYQCVLWQTVFCALVDWWDSNARAPFGLTVGQLAMGILRSYVKPKSISSHRDGIAHKLERLASHGGRASVWFMGNIGDGIPHSGQCTEQSSSVAVPSVPGPITHLDIRSMYPSILHSCAFPAKYHKRHGQITPKNLSELQRYYGTIAHVRVRIHNAEYPMRTDKGTVYPRGVFQTVLAGPDLESLTGHDEVLEVYECITYILSTPFQRAAEFLLKTRINARNSGDLAWELFAKTLSNSLGGKLAQRSGSWVDRRDMVAERLWGEWFDYNADTSTARKFRAISGMVSEYINDDTGKGPYTASFAYLTAYGRQLMRKIRAAFDSETVVSQDTDGLWVLGDIPYIALADIVSFGDSPGQLKIKEVSNNGRFFGPQHYYTDSGWVLSGFSDDSGPNEVGEIRDSYTANPLLSGARELPISIRRINRVSRSNPVSNTSGISPYGWIRPLYIEPSENVNRFSH